MAVVENPFLETDRRIVGEIYTGDEMSENLEALCDGLGSRFAGSEEEAEAAQFLAEKMREYGLASVRKEAVTYTGWVRGDVSLHILEPVESEVACITLPHSPPVDVTAEVVDVGDGSPEDFEAMAEELAGKFVLTNSVTYPGSSKRWIHRNEKYGRALLAGAAGFIFVNHYPGYGPATGSIGQDEPQCGPGAMPGISVSYEDGAYLQRLLARHGRLRLYLKSDDQFTQATSWNIIGDLPGSAEDGEVVMLGCHYDGHDIAQGATDPISGTVALLEAARVLAKYAPSPAHTIRFAHWSAEEIGLIGSTQYALAHETELERIRFYLNMDGAGAIETKDIILNEWPDLAPLLASYRDQMALSFGIGQSLNAHSDHYPFMVAGVPTGGIGSVKADTGGRGYGHTRYDTVDKVERRGLREAAALAARLALRMAEEKSWPVGRRSQAAVREILDSPDYRAEQALTAEVRAFYDDQR
jgi:Zn-dependent M28 family amino/carboxypeptidase